MDAVATLRRTRLALLVVIVLCLGLAAACVVLFRRAAEGGPAPDAIDDPKLREEAVAKLVARAGGVWDTFPDAEVGRLLRPSTSVGDYDGVKVSSDRIGLREKDFDLPKPEGVIRVVILGDSFVFGQGVDASQRFGAVLGLEFARHSGSQNYFECLHFGQTCWNIIAETAFLRRSLSLVKPDLVVHLIIRNDLEDNPGARGFGTISRFDPLHGMQGEPLFQQKTPPEIFRTRRSSWIASGLDWESTSRYREAGRRVQRLADLVEQAGGRYLMVDYFTTHHGLARKYLAAGLRPEQICSVPSEIAKTEELKVDDIHWNAEGNELIAKILYSVIQSRGLLPRLNLKPWPEADAAAQQWLPRGEAEAAREVDDDVAMARRVVGRRIDFAKIDNNSASQVTGGVARDGAVAPYASLVLACGGAKRVAIEGHGLGRLELDGTRVTIDVDEKEVGSFVVKGDAPIRFAADLPADAAAREFVSVRFTADDFAYAAPDLRQHVVFALEKVALE